MTTLAERMKTAMGAKGCTLTELARAAGVKPPSVSDWLSGKTKTLKAATAFRAARFLNVSELWLIEGKGSMRNYATDGHRSDQQKCESEVAPYVATLSPRDLPFPLKEIIDIAKTMSRDAQIMLLERAQILAQQYPAAKANRSN